jgi:hypothetical protein
MPTHRTQSKPRPIWPWAVAAALAGLAAIAWVNRPYLPEFGPEPSLPDLPLDRQLNAFFSADWGDVTDVPEVRRVELPKFPGPAFIWGATGRDADGHVWVGVSFHETRPASARLVEYDPDADRAAERGDALGALAEAGLLHAGEEQPKIHSRFFQATDGHLYFASMDDTHGEGGHEAPRWGSHLWRLRLPERRWEHVLAAREGLIAVAGAGRFVYALGYPDHALIQYDCESGGVRRTVVGSAAGHVSRNLMVDARGHAFVPRLRAAAAGGPLESSLVEYDRALREVGTNPLPHYVEGAPDACHGIVGVQPLVDRSVAFTTHLGRLFRVVADGPGPARLIDLGWMHPDGSMYTPSLFSPDGSSGLVGVGRPLKPPNAPFQWLRHDLRLRLSLARRFPLTGPDGRPPYEIVLYGSQTQDRAGNVYLVGSQSDGGVSQPIVLRVGPVGGVPAPRAPKRE